MARRRQPLRLRVGALTDAVVLDLGALIGAAEGHPRVRAELTLAEQLGAKVYVNSVTLTEVLRGHPRDAAVHHLLGGVQTEPVSPELGREAGELLGRTARDDTVDAIVAVTAARAGPKVRLLTGDPNDLQALTADMAGVTVVPI